MDALRHAPWVHQSCPAAMDHFQNTVSACVSLLLCPGLCQYTLAVNVPSATLTSGGYKLGGQCPSLPISESSVHSILRGGGGEEGQDRAILVVHSGDLLLNYTWSAFLPALFHSTPFPDSHLHPPFWDHLPFTLYIPMSMFKSASWGTRTKTVEMAVSVESWGRT